MEMNFDPMTGQPVQPQNVQAQGVITGYDPMTGQPIYAGANATFTAATAAKAGIGTGVKIAIAAAAAVAVIVVGAFAGVKSGAFLKPAGKVAVASLNTVMDAPMLLEDANFATTLEAKGYTVGVEMSYEGNRVALECVNNNKKQQLYAKLDMAGASDIAGYLTLDDEALYLSVPDLLDDSVVYYYTKDNKGDLMDYLDRDTIEQLNALLTTIHSQKKTDESMEKYVQKVRDEIKSLKYKKVSAEKFEVNGKSRKCKGYSTTITSDNINNILDAYMEYMEESMPDELMNYSSWREVKESMRQVQREVDRMDDLDIEFFVYKSKLACIRTEIGGDDVELLFKGGDYRMQNMELIVDDETVAKMEGERDGSTETIKVKVMNQTLLKVEYDSKSGDFEIKVEDAGSIKGNIEKNRKGTTLTISKISGMEGMKLKVYTSKSTDFKEVDKKHLFDIGGADESDLRDFIYDIDMNKLYNYGDMLDDIF